ncbi:hypothetical protein KSD_94290 [Ktedonobacter sp. SOSP1-85]|uniref:hypothetical protein n=1 Tax=Ktedonobacter sp. SOSP1-85 TaxID=2778367 RepID=UPI001A2226C6|nr:hypothetical protein [Ktedonobacter sp. SOSP1-85]GHO81658.1 hypothetical protein KSD_94290 [Ktedonobacter sp. SOSP1-85]
MTTLPLTEFPLEQNIQQVASQTHYNQTIRSAHPFLVQLLDILLPANGGLSFLEAFLSQATVESAGEAAVVRARNQRELARLLGLDYDRTNKYVLVLQQMRVLQVREERPGIALYLPLGEPRLAHPDTLDALTSYRPKVASFARQVKQRWLALLATKDACILSCTSQFAQTTQADKAPSTSHKGFVDLEDVRQAIFDLFDPVAAHRLLHEIENLASQRSTPTTTGVATPKGDSPSEMTTTNGDLATHIGDSPSLREKAKGDSPAQKGNSPSGKATTIGDSVNKIGDSPSGEATTIGDSVSKIGDSPATESPEKRRLVATKMGDSGATSAHTIGDSSPSEVATHLSNVNVTLLNLIKNVNVNVREIASDLCQIFGEASQQQGYYIQLARQHNNPQAWLGALLETLFAQKRGSVLKPGDYFYKRCIALHKALPTETIQLMERFGTYTYAKQNV